MPFQSYMTVSGKKQGQLKGSSSKKPGQSSTSHIPIISFGYGTSVPYDAASGLSSGKRAHSPVVITREVDSSSPALFHCFVTAEGFTTAVIELPKPGSAGHSTKGDTIELTNGFITAVSHATSKGGKRRESLTLVFEDIKVNGAPGAPKGGVEHYWWRDTW